MEKDHYWQVRLEVSFEQIEAHEASLWELGALSLSLEPSEENLVIDERLYAGTPLFLADQMLYLIAVFVDKITLPFASDQILDWQKVPTENWHLKWLAEAKPVILSERLAIYPEHLPAQGQAHILRLNPSMAFGTGTHPTSRLCLRYCDSYFQAGENLLDYGCGSGIIGLCALLLGASKLTLIDHDPQAIDCALENARKNNLNLDQISTAVADDPPQGQAYDWVFANIISSIILPRLQALMDCVKPQGTLVLSGFLCQEMSMVREVLEAHCAWCFEEEWVEEDWYLVAGRRR